MGWNDQPDIRPCKESGNNYILAQTYAYQWERKGQVVRLTIPQYFQCDLSTSPRWAWSLIGFLPDGVHRKASILHDFIYEYEGRMPTLSFMRKAPLTAYDDSNGTDTWRIVPEKITRLEADQLFRQAMIEEGIKSWHAAIAYAAVRTFGYFLWKE